LTIDDFTTDGARLLSMVARLLALEESGRTDEGFRQAGSNARAFSGSEIGISGVAHPPN